VSDNPIFCNPTYYFTFQDPLIGTMDLDAKHIVDLTYLDDIEKEIDSYDYGEFAILAEHEKNFIKVFRSKANLGVRLKDAYDARDKDTLAQMAETEIPALIENLRKMKFSHLMMWERYLHPFAFESMDSAYGRLSYRLETAVCRISQYLRGEIDCIKELEEERLPFFSNGSGPLTRSVNQIPWLFPR
ncbi:MAG: hypothetical protein IJ367_00010, partial [Clostridia bacterium]|nr:hypothetical protein [Clostridia bacterium]